SVERMLRAFRAEGKKPAFKLPKVLLLDIETAQILMKGWRSGQQFIHENRIMNDPYIICWQAKWLYDSHYMGACVTPKEAVARNDKRILQEAWALVDEADMIIGHNVEKFDLNTLNAHFAKHDMMPPRLYQTIDTLAHSRRVFRLPSQKLDYLTKFFKLPEKLRTNIWLWDDCENGDEDALKRMFRYCKRDVGGLEELYLKIRPWMKSHPNLVLYGDMTEMRCSYCGSDNLKRNGQYVTMMNKYQTYRCKDCQGISRGRKSMIDKLQRKQLTRSPAR
ncbi:hypothetical protein LCGC14_1821630, partial [marine sediment metagenome]